MCTLSSCLQNEEPAGIEVLRNAKAELIKAQAQYATAQAAYVSAQVAYQELVNAEKELDNRIKAAEAAYWEAYYQYQAAVEQAKSEQEIAYWEAEMLRQQNEKELIIERHKKALLDAQTATAQAEYNYQVAMDALALASSSLSQAEKEAIAGYRQDIEEVRKALETAQKGIAGAQTDLLDAKYYKYGVTRRSFDLPGTSSISKQITYGEYIFKNKRSNSKTKVYNAFIMPFNSSVQSENRIQYIGTATSEWKNNDFDYEKVLGILVDVKYLMQITNSKNYDAINELSNLIEEKISKI